MRRAAAADAIIPDAVNLLMDGSLLAGKSVAGPKMRQSDGNDPHAQVFSGTLVVQGKRIALVTGRNTQFGKNGISLQGIEPDKTRLQRDGDCR